MTGLLNAVFFVFAWVIFIFLTVGLGIFVIPVYYLLVFRNSAFRAKKAEEKLQSALMKEELIIETGLQKRLYALLTRRKLIAITSSRIILIDRSLLGGFSMKDYQWKDLRDAKIYENILPKLCGSKISFSVNKFNSGISIDGLSSKVAADIYVHAQSQEQQWEEKNRIRALEEKRAASGGAIFNVEGTKSAPAGESIFERLERAKNLLDSGAISDSEYQELKSKVLNNGAF